MDFIKNIVRIDVDGLRGVNHYTIYAMYNKTYVDDYGEYCKLEEELIDKFDYTWKEINSEGGVGEVHKQIKECYNAEFC